MMIKIILFKKCKIIKLNNSKSYYLIVYLITSLQVEKIL